MGARGCKHKPARIVTRYSVLGDVEVTGPDYRNWWRTDGVCEYGNCTELLCPVCGCGQGGWGPMECPCEDWIGYHDMRREPVPAAVKPSAARPGRRIHRRRIR